MSVTSLGKIETLDSIFKHGISKEVAAVRAVLGKYQRNTETLFKKKGIEPVRKVRKKDKHLLDASVFVGFPIFHSPSSRTWYLNYDNKTRTYQRLRQIGHC